MIDHIVLESNKSASARGASITEITAKRRATAKKALETHEKRCTAGLIASAGKFQLNKDILRNARHSNELQDAKQCEKQLKAKDAYDSLHIKVEAIRNKYLPPEKWTSAELNTMIQWFKHPDDTAMPPKKTDKLTRYLNICGCGDPVPPQLPTLMPSVPSLLPLPPRPPAVNDLPELAAADDLCKLELAAALESAAVENVLEPVSVDDVLELTVDNVLDSDEGDLALAADDDSANGLLRQVFGFGV